MERVGYLWASVEFTLITNFSNYIMKVNMCCGFRDCVLVM